MVIGLEREDNEVWDLRDRPICLIAREWLQVELDDKK